MRSIVVSLLLHREMVLLTMFLATSIAFAAMRFFLPSTSTKAFTLLANKKLWRFFCGIFLVAYVLLVLLSTFYHYCPVKLQGAGCK